MPESAAPHAEPRPDSTRVTSSSDRAVPPMPSEATSVAVPPMPSEVTSARAGRLAAGSMWHRATMPLHKMMHRTPR